MNKLVTILIPTHNRHHYLQRILAYYQDAGIQLVVADSTKDAYQGGLPPQASVRYYHRPHLSLPAKLDWAMQQVATPYVVMCSDDDFTVPDGISQCVAFLEANKDYAVAQGNCMIYSKTKAIAGKMDYTLMYRNLLSFRLSSDEPFERIQHLFQSYRTPFTAVHRTQNLQLAFAGAGTAVNNLFLNEYNTVFVPLVAGKYAELPLFFQVREFAEDSDDKVTDDIDKIWYGQNYREERTRFVGFISEKITGLINLEKSAVSQKVTVCLHAFADAIAAMRLPSQKKKIGHLVSSVPFIGKLVIQLNRRFEKRNDLKKIIRTEADRQNLLKIESIIQKFSSTIH